jgi:hypothetical protein
VRIEKQGAKALVAKMTDAEESMDMAKEMTDIALSRSALKNEPLCGLP